MSPNNALWSVMSHLFACAIATGCGTSQNGGADVGGQAGAGARVGMAGALSPDGGGSPAGLGGADESGGASGASFGSSGSSSGGFNEGGLPGAGGAASSGGSGGRPPQVFNHPGLPLTLEDLNALKSNLANEPWKSAYAALQADSHSQLSYVMQGPFATVSRTPDVNLGQYRNDMQAVFNLARMWFFTGNSAFGKKGRDIMISWAKTHTTWSGAEPYLTMGDYAYRMYGGADILRGTWPGWTQADTDACKAYFSEVYWSAAVVPRPLRSANQGVEQLITGVGVATFNDDPEKFLQTLQAFRADAVGGIANSLPSGAVGDSGRDQGHAYGQQMHLAWIAEVFWKQGVDVYSELDNRLLAAGEFYSRYNLGIPTPFMQFGSEYDIYPTHGLAPNSSPQPPDFLNLVHGAYVVRKKLSAPYVTSYRALRPETSDSFVFRKIEDESSAAPAPALPPQPATASVTKLTSVDIGGASPIGTSSYAAGTWSIQAGGSDIGGAADSFRFVYLPVTGNGSVLARVTSVQSTTGDEKAGIMIREALNANAKMLGVYMLPMNTINGHTGPHAFVNMRGQLASSHNLASQTHRLWDATTVTLPYWLKLERVGNRITAYHSIDGASWSTIQCADFVLGSTAFMGIAVSSRVNGKLSKATFTDIRISGGDGGEPATLPAAPFAIYGAPGDAQVSLRWLESFGATSYRLMRATGAGPYTSVATLSGTSYVDQGLTTGIGYRYVVRALNSTGQSGDSPPESVTLRSP